MELALPAPRLGALVFTRLQHSGAIEPPSERGMTGQAPCLSGEENEDGLGYFLCRVCVGENAKCSAVHEPDVSLHELGERALIGIRDETAQTFSIGS
jgi:hypothetical protein